MRTLEAAALLMCLGASATGCLRDCPDGESRTESWNGTRFEDVRVNHARDRDTWLVRYQDDQPRMAEVDAHGNILAQHVVDDRALLDEPLVVDGGDGYLLVQAGGSVDYGLADHAGHVTRDLTTISDETWIDQLDARWNGRAYDVVWARITDDDHADLLLSRVDASGATAPITVGRSDWGAYARPRVARAGDVTWVLWTSAANGAAQAVGVRVDDAGHVLDRSPVVLATPGAILAADSIGESALALSSTTLATADTITLTDTGAHVAARALPIAESVSLRAMPAASTYLLVADGGDPLGGFEDARTFGNVLRLDGAGLPIEPSWTQIDGGARFAVETGDDALIVASIDNTIDGDDATAHLRFRALDTQLHTRTDHSLVQHDLHRTYSACTPTPPPGGCQDDAGGGGSGPLLVGLSLALIGWRRRRR